MTFTVGVEEEFLLLDPATGENVPAAPAVYGRLPADVRELSRPEFRPSMVEMVTGVCTGLTEVRDQLTRLRAAAAEAAAGAGALLVAMGATPVGEPRPAITDNPRFRAIDAHYGPIVRDPSVCGCHVHVGVPDREAAVRAGNHLRNWLPVLQALTVNSPFHDGADTGHASWRAMQLDRWPSLGPAPWFASAADLDRTVDRLVASGAMLDESLILWHCRPSATWPTIEVRVADVCPTVDDAVLLTGLVRALVATALEDDPPAVQVPDHLVQAAHWNAAHQGLDGTLLDLHELRARPAWDLVGDLVEAVTPALTRHGDLRLVTAELDRVRAEGTGADRLRRDLRRTGSLPATLAAAAARTTGLAGPSTGIRRTMTTPSTNQFAVVTGASSGIGFELARQFAEHGYDLLVAAEDEGIRQAAANLRRDGVNQITDVRVDLATADGVQRLAAAIAETGRPVDALVLNAGRGIGGDFVRETALADELNVIDLNVTSTVHLAKLVLPAMVERNSGGVLFTSSIASTMPGTYQAVYNASKSFVQSFAEALREELKDTDVTVTSLMPGPTDTNFFERAEMQDTRVGAGSKDDPAVVAKQGFEALQKDRAKVVAGSAKTKVQGLANKVLPDSAKAKMHRKMAEPGSAEK